MRFPVLAFQKRHFPEITCSEFLVLLCCSVLLGAVPLMPLCTWYRAVPYYHSSTVMHCFAVPLFVSTVRQKRQNCQRTLAFLRTPDPLSVGVLPR